VTGFVDIKIHEELVSPIVRALNPIAAGAKAFRPSREATTRPMGRSYLGWDGKDAGWYAGFVCSALEQAAFTLGVKLPIDSSPSCDVLAKEAKDRGKLVPEARMKSGAFPKKDLVPGSFFLVRKVPNDWVHVGIVTAPDKESFDTAEGNTDSGGSQNGFEAPERTRDYRKKDFIVW
jgi:hypothetical protein